VTLLDGGTLFADLLIVGIGSVPDTDLARQAGLAIDNGIAVDGQLRTSDPNVYAGGDCCSFPLSIYGGRRVRLESWRNAQEHGALVATSMLGIEDLQQSVPWFWSDQFDHTLYVTGLYDEGHALIRRDLANGAFIIFHLSGDGRLVAASGFGQGNAVARDVRLAEKLIAARSRPEPRVLAQPHAKLKMMLV
jgi:3-phenylpropionate/trans-cinnamate dioxygenase ferredoxin reductase subunit